MTKPPKIVRQEFPWGVIEWLASAEVGNSSELSLARLSLSAGQATDTHRHSNCEESVYVTRGKIECSANGRTAVLVGGDQLTIPRGAVHGLRNVGTDPAEVILSYSSSTRAFALA